MKIYTKTGDAGETGTFRGPRVRKDAARIEGYGAVDELNAFLGQARCEDLPPEVDALLRQIQNDLFDVGAELATPDAASKDMLTIGAQHIQTLEAAIDRFEADLPKLTHFILPGGAKGAACLHIARTVCRRAERRVVTLMAKPESNVASELLIYLNRLSDLLFVLARATNAAAGQPDVAWIHRDSQPPS